jgi:hypothetical protein
MRGVERRSVFFQAFSTWADYCSFSAAVAASPGNLVPLIPPYGTYRYHMSTEFMTG